MTRLTCPECHHQWEEEIVVPDWYETLVACAGAKRAVPPYEHCKAWLDEDEKRWRLVEEMAAVVETYWDPPKKKSPWGMLRTYVGKELRLQSERTAASQGGLLRKSEGRY